MKSRALTSTKLRLILSIVLLLTFIITGTVFYFGYQRLDTMAIDVGAKVASAKDSQNTLQQLQKLKQELEADQDVVNKTSLIAADGENYTYQDQIVGDITTYADRAGMTIGNITFSVAGSGAAPSGVSSPATPAPSGIKTTTVTVSLKNPSDYRGLLNFLHYIEQNLTKMKVANITLTKGEGDTVNTDVLNLEIHLR